MIYVYDPTGPLATLAEFEGCLDELEGAATYYSDCIYFEFEPEPRHFPRLASAHRLALEEAESSVHVSIHVGQEVWDELLSLGGGVAPATVWGYPVVLEADWLPGVIKVRVETVIR